ALVSFLSAVMGASAGGQALTVTGNASFGGAVGGTPLKSLAVSGATTINAGSITTNAAGAGTQTYTGAVTLASDTALSASAGAGTPALVSFGGAVTAASAGGQ